MASKASNAKKVEEFKQKEAEMNKVVAPQRLKEYEDLKTTLRNSKAGEENNLYEHVIEVLNHIIIHCPEEALSKLEEISFLLKKENCDNFNREQFLDLEPCKNYNRFDGDVKAHTQALLEQLQKQMVVSYTFLWRQSHSIQLT